MSQYPKSLSLVPIVLSLAFLDPSPYSLVLEGLNIQNLSLLIRCVVGGWWLYGEFRESSSIIKAHFMGRGSDQKCSYSRAGLNV